MAKMGAQASGAVNVGTVTRDLGLGFGVLGC